MNTSSFQVHGTSLLFCSLALALSKGGALVRVEAGCEPACGKRATAVTLSGAPGLMGFPSSKIHRISPSPQWKGKHMASFLGAKQAPAGPGKLLLRD